MTYKKGDIVKVEQVWHHIWGTCSGSAGKTTQLSETSTTFFYGIIIKEEYEEKDFLIFEMDLTNHRQTEPPTKSNYVKIYNLKSRKMETISASDIKRKIK